MPQGEPLPRLWMEILAQAQEFLDVGDLGQTKRFGALADPLARDGLVLGVIVAHREVLLEVPLGVTQAVLCFGRQHGQQITPTLRNCVNLLWACTGAVCASCAIQTGDERTSVTLKRRFWRSELRSQVEA